MQKEIIWLKIRLEHLETGKDPQNIENQIVSLKREILTLTEQSRGIKSLLYIQTKEL